MNKIQINGKYKGAVGKTACFLLILLAIAACKTTKIISKPETIQLKPVAELIAKVQKVQPDFKSANVSKMTLAVEMGDRKVNVSASCKIRKDSAIYMSIQPFMGIEFFKVEMMPDTIRVFDKMNNRYYAVDYSFFAKRFGVDVDFYSLQSILFGRLFCVGHKEMQTDSCRLSETNTIDYQTKNMIQSTEISKDYSLKKVVLKSKNNGYQLETNYGNYTLQDSILFPQDIHLQVASRNSRASCDFSILRVSFNQALNFRPTSPDRFSKGEIEKLLKKE